ncbi:hypothetical protein OHR86_22590 [Streptomyces sp. NBC_00441]|uniref:hypothetical protein n=1 Tax=Streptomyces sp. NBC_00441 TaxID=2975742 RepID=UPI002E2C390C|nr:hypothetical protein [Streptomyces sp. NBC_00441]
MNAPKDDALAAAGAEHGPFPMPTGGPSAAELAEQRHLLDPLDHVLEHLADERPVSRDTRSGAAAAWRMLAERDGESV